MSTLLHLTYLSIIILLGLLCSVAAKKLNVSNVLLLLLTGILLRNIRYQGQQLLSFPVEFIAVISLVALAIIVFDSSSHFKVREFDAFSVNALKLSLIFLALNMALLSIAAYYLFGIQSFFIAALFAALMSGTSPDTVLSMMADTRHKVVEFLKIESIVNTPMMVLIPFLIIDLINSVTTAITVATFVDQIVPFLQQIITGIGAGILVGLMVFKVMRRQYSDTLSPLAMVGAALLSYVLAENLGGNGVLAVTCTGIFFGNVYVKQKSKLVEFSSLFSAFLQILVFILVGLLIRIPLTFDFLFRSVLLFISFIVIRYLAIMLSFPSGTYTYREKVFMALVAPKGIAVAVVATALFSYTVPGAIRFIPGLSSVLDLVLMFTLYSIIISSAVLRFSGRFLSQKVIR